MFLQDRSVVVCLLNVYMKVQVKLTYKLHLGNCGHVLCVLAIRWIKLQHSLNKLNSTVDNILSLLNQCSDKLYRENRANTILLNTATFILNMRKMTSDLKTKQTKKTQRQGGRERLNEWMTALYSTGKTVREKEKEKKVTAAFQHPVNCLGTKTVKKLISVQIQEWRSKNENHICSKQDTLH